METKSQGVIYILTNPSKREIVRVALSDLTKNEEEGTLYQLIHRLGNVIRKK